MKNLIRICLFTMLLFVTGDLAAQNIHLSTPRTSLVLSAPARGELKYVYYGSKLTEMTVAKFIMHLPCNMWLIRYMV